MEGFGGFGVTSRNPASPTHIPRPGPPSWPASPRPTFCLPSSRLTSSPPHSLPPDSLPTPCSIRSRHLVMEMMQLSNDCYNSPCQRRRTFLFRKWAIHCYRLSRARLTDSINARVDKEVDQLTSFILGVKQAHACISKHNHLYITHFHDLVCACN